MKTKKQVEELAISDIAKEMAESGIEITIYTVSAESLRTKQNRRLNKALGLHRINKNKV